MTVEVITTPQSWVCPAGVQKIDVVLLGGGGGGGCTKTALATGKAGAAGSTTSQNLVSVTPGNSYSLVVGQGGAGAYYIPGNDSIFIPANGVTTTGFGYSAAGGANGGSVAGDKTPTGNGGIGGDPAYATGGVGGDGSITITYVLPSAAFTGTPLVGPKPLTVAFTGPAACTTYAWDFGDSETASTQSPSHEYHNAGKKTVILVTTNSYGFTVNTKVDYVTALFKKRMHAVAQMSDGLRRT